MTDLTLDLLKWCRIDAWDDATMVLVSEQYQGEHDGPWTFRDFKCMVEHALVTRDREIERKSRYGERMDALAEERLIEVTRLRQGFAGLVTLVDELEANRGI